MAREPHPGHSEEQQEAEHLLVAGLGEKCGVPLERKRLIFGNRGWLELDGVCDDPPIFCEAWAHQGPPKAAQKNKVMSDAFKLMLASRLTGKKARLIMAFGDSEAASHFQGESWMAEALRSSGIEIMVLSLPDDVRERIRSAQNRQYR